jgi:hypothetical protein
MWLTYRYRLGGPGIAEVSGTIKAPTFLEAARRVVRRRLTNVLATHPAYVRLRAAGEDEVLLRITGAAGRDGRPSFEVVSPDAFEFAAPRAIPARGEGGSPR